MSHSTGERSKSDRNLISKKPSLIRHRVSKKPDPDLQATLVHDASDVMKYVIRSGGRAVKLSSALGDIAMRNNIQRMILDLLVLAAAILCSLRCSRTAMPHL